MSHVVIPESVRCQLSDGSFVEIKKELNAGEYFDLMVALSERKAYSKLVAYITSWSLVGADDKPLRYGLDMDEQARRDTIRALKKPVTREIAAIIDRHEDEEERALAKKKATPALSLVSNPISASAAP
jgi:hypothetical protein